MTNFQHKITIFIKNCPENDPFSTETAKFEFEMFQIRFRIYLVHNLIKNNCSKRTIFRRKWPFLSKIIRKRPIFDPKQKNQKKIIRIRLRVNLVHKMIKNNWLKHIFYAQNGYFDLKRFQKRPIFDPKPQNFNFNCSKSVLCIHFWIKLYPRFCIVAKISK